MSACAARPALCSALAALALAPAIAQASSATPPGAARPVVAPTPTPLVELMIEAPLLRVTVPTASCVSAPGATPPRKFSTVELVLEVVV